ncbi:phosphoinositide phosphatase SAC7-like [Panicum miliaceum]|uniref:Phosphoinositide phosphatase SAC7-like n=1 Tax=Panicum miliaceum TaxID=4540 RepID=A0A3L6PIQ3_PANMI|nr:phosphoinositide phosphatase SAC7-like [Panicum miliaceum]
MGKVCAMHAAMHAAQKSAESSRPGKEPVDEPVREPRRRRAGRGRPLPHGGLQLGEGEEEVLGVGRVEHAVCVVERLCAGERLVEPPPAEVGVEEVGEEELQDGEEDGQAEYHRDAGRHGQPRHVIGEHGAGRRLQSPGRAHAGRHQQLKKFLEQRPEPDLVVLLLMGFLERTGGQGLIVKSWAPQVAVLRHQSTGAWEMEGYTMGSIGADKVEAKVQLVMDSEEGRELRARVEEAMAALEDDMWGHEDPILAPASRALSGNFDTPYKQHSFGNQRARRPAQPLCCSNTDLYFRYPTMDVPSNCPSPKLHTRLRLWEFADRYVFEPVDGLADLLLSVSQVNGSMNLIEELPQRGPSTNPKVQIVFGVIGVLKLAVGTYLLVITDRDCVGSYLGHAVFKVTGLRVLPCNSSPSASAEQKNVDTEFSELLDAAERTIGLYFSYDSNLTVTSQRLHELGDEFKSLPLWRQVAVPKGISVEVTLRGRMKEGKLQKGAVKARQVDSKPPPRQSCVAVACPTSIRCYLADLKGDWIHSLAFLLALQKAPVLTPLRKLCSLSSGS